MKKILLLLIPLLLAGCSYHHTKPSTQEETKYSVGVTKEMVENLGASLGEIIHPGIGNWELGKKVVIEETEILGAKSISLTETPEIIGEEIVHGNFRIYFDIWPLIFPPK